MKGATLTDLVVQELLRTVLENIQSDPEVVDELFDMFIKSHLNFFSTKGKRELKEIRKYLKNNQIHVMDGWNIAEAKVPVYAVYLGGNSEVDAEAMLDDFGTEQFVDENGEVVNKYPSMLDTIEIPDHVGKEEVRTSAIQETVIIDCISENSLLTRYLAYLLHYILRFNKDNLLDLCINRINISFSDFAPFQGHDKLPDYLFRRTCTLRCHTFISSVTDVSDQLVSAIDVKVIAEDDTTTDQGDLETDIIVTRERD